MIRRSVPIAVAAFVLAAVVPSPHAEGAQADPRVAAAARIASLEKIDRADLAVLLVRVVGIDALLRDTPFRGGDAPVLSDVAGHRFAHEIAEVARYRIRGLEPLPDGSFRPDRTVRRADLAVALEDVLARVTGEAALPRRFLAGPSPFRDVSEGHFAYTAIVVCTTRGIMSANAAGWFGADRPVTGAAAVDAARRLLVRAKKPRDDTVLVPVVPDGEEG